MAFLGALSFPVKPVLRKVGVVTPQGIESCFFLGVARFLDYFKNAPGLTTPVSKGSAKVRFKFQRCCEPKKFVKHLVKSTLSSSIICSKLSFLLPFVIQWLLNSDNEPIIKKKKKSFSNVCEWQWLYVNYWTNFHRFLL